MSSTMAYNVAFAWSRHADIYHWRFRENAVNETNIKCVEYEYETLIKIPGLFAQYVTNLMRHISIKKDVCLVSGEYVENVHVSHTSVIQNLKSRSQSHVKDGNLVSDITISYDLPWYVNFIETLASKHIMKSFTEKFKIFSEMMCTEVAV